MAPNSQIPSKKRGPITQLVQPFFRLAIPAAATVALFSNGTDKILGSFPLKALSVLSVLLTLEGIFVFRTACRSWASGCTPAPRFPHREPVLGVDLFVAALKALKTGVLLDFFHAQFGSLGRTFTYSALGTPTVITMEPEIMKAVLQTNFEDWPIMGPRKEMLAPLLGDGNIFQSNGKAWHHARAMIRPSFVRDQIADLNCFDRHISNMIKKIPKGETVDLQKLFFMMTMDSSSDFILGHCTNILTTGSPKTLAFNEAFDYALLVATFRGRLGKLCAIVPDKKFDHSVTVVREFVAEYVQEAIDLQTKKKKESSSSSSSTVAADGAEKRNYVFLPELLKTGASTEYICDQVLGIFLAGRDTTAAALSTLFWTLARHPDVVRRLRKEVMTIREGEMPTWEELKNMTYLQHCIKEILRLYPPVPTNARGASRDTILPVGGGSDGKSPMYVKKGTVIRWSSYSLHRYKECFGEDADEFNPDRWEKIRPTWEYLPFNGGPRICPGQQFAITQISLVVFKMLRAFESIEPRDDRPMLQTVSTTVSLPNGVLVNMVPTAS